MQRIGDLLKTNIHDLETVNSISFNLKKENNTVNSYGEDSILKNNPQETVNSNTVYGDEGEIDETLPLNDQDPSFEDFPLYLANELDDLKSLPYYRKLFSIHGREVLMEALNITLEADKCGQINTKKCHYFRGILKQKGLQTNFRRET